MSDTSVATEVGSVPAVEQLTTSETTSGISGAPLAVSLLVAAAAASIVLNFMPFRFSIPAELVSVNMYSPPELQREAAAADEAAYWKNTIAVFALMGLCFGAVSWLTTLWRGFGRRSSAAIRGLLWGAACGVLAAVLGILVRRFLDSGTILTMVDEGSRALIADMIVYAVISVLLISPTILALWNSGAQGQKIAAIPLAGLLVGLLLPLLASIVLPAAPTNLFPPEGLALSGLWLGLLAILTFCLISLTGSRQRMAK